MLFPYLVYTYLLRHVWRVLSREDALGHTEEDLVLARRLMDSEFPNEVVSVVDLTAEFTEPHGIRSLPGYCCYPTLDGSAIEPELLREAANAVLGFQSPVLIHCANGHGRTGTLAGAVFLLKGVVSSPEEAVQRLKECRPGLALNRRQMKALHLLCR